METKSELILKGIAAAPGISISKAYLYKKEVESANNEKVEDVDEALENFEFAREKSKKELNKVLSLAVDKLGKKRGAIFEAQIMILDDPFLIDKIKNRISAEKINPEYIVDNEISKYQKILNDSDESYMKERSRDIEDIKYRIIRNLKKKKWKSRIDSEVVVVTESLTPADTILFSRENVSGYVTNFGGLTSHAAILARSLSIPAVLGVHDATSQIEPEDIVVIDGFHGLVYVNPTEERLEHFRERIKKLELFDKELDKLKKVKAVTKDGRRINIHGNLDLREELELMISNGAEGIGLVRTEQITEEYEEFPGEEEQLKIYNALAEKLYPKTMTIRVLDIGGDKVLPVDVKEPNPFLGWRGIRFLEDNVPLFKTQIRAILRASNHKNIRLMIPMITSMEEIINTKNLIELCKKELKKEGLQFDEDIKIGIMIEVPSAAVMAKEYASEVDFISIGTNDLIQYLLAVDRGNDIVQKLYQEFHPAVIRVLNNIINDVKIESKIDVSICGEMAADPLAVPLLVGIGLDTLSVSAAAIPQTKKIIRSLNYSEVRLLAEECLSLRTENEIKEKVKKFYNEKLIDCTVQY
ncbi:MAG: phosphoenolpyruvate--protein phosphotransferase [Melioribacteraceae bacterium]|nr:phosphoenolpyruvate--protein phosphotransferase [Melioribacteraceae bacterium]